MYSGRQSIYAQVIIVSYCQLSTAAREGSANSARSIPGDCDRLTTEGSDTVRNRFIVTTGFRGHGTTRLHGSRVTGAWNRLPTPLGACARGPQAGARGGAWPDGPQRPVEPTGPAVPQAGARGGEAPDGPRRVCARSTGASERRTGARRPAALVPQAGAGGGGGTD